MGCCTSLQNDLFTGKEIIVNLGPKEIEEFIGRNRNNSKKFPIQNIPNFLLKPWKQIQKVQKRQKNKKKVEIFIIKEQKISRKI